MLSNNRAEYEACRNRGGKTSRAREPLEETPSCKLYRYQNKRKSPHSDFQISSNEHVKRGSYFGKEHTWVVGEDFLDFVAAGVFIFYFNKQWHSRSLFSVLAWMDAPNRKYVITGHKRAVTSICPCQGFLRLNSKNNASFTLHKGSIVSISYS